MRAYTNNPRVWFQKRGVLKIINTFLIINIYEKIAHFFREIAQYSVIMCFSIKENIYALFFPANINIRLDFSSIVGGAQFPFCLLHT